MTVTRKSNNKQWNKTIRSRVGHVEKDQNTGWQTEQMKGQASRAVICAPIITGYGPEIEQHWL